MRKNTNTSNTESKTIEHDPREKPRKPLDPKRRSKAARGPWAKLMRRSLIAMAVTAVGYFGYIAVNQTDDVGYAGILSSKADGMSLSCGGEYDAESLVIFHPTLPCGSYVKVLNPANDVAVVAQVASNTVMFRKGNGRNADVSTGLAEKLGLNTEALVPAVISLRPFTGLSKYVPMHAQYQSKAPVLPALKDSDRKALTMNLIGECAKCGIHGMVAVGQATLNRWEQRFNGKVTVESVVFDTNQFSWTRAPSTEWPSKATLGWVRSYVLAGQLMTDQLSGDNLAIQYLVTRDATYYYAFDVIATPYWGSRRGKLEVVPMSNTLEVELWHRFFREKGFNAPVPEKSAIVMVKATSNKVTLPRNGPVPSARPKGKQTTAGSSDDVKNLILAAN